MLCGWEGGVWGGWGGGGVRREEKGKARSRGQGRGRKEDIDRRKKKTPFFTLTHQVELEVLEGLALEQVVVVVLPQQSCLVASDDGLCKFFFELRERRRRKDDDDDDERRMVLEEEAAEEEGHQNRSFSLAPFSFPCLGLYLPRYPSCALKSRASRPAISERKPGKGGRGSLFSFFFSFDAL